MPSSKSANRSGAAADRPLVLGCLLAVLLVTLAACGRSAPKPTSASANPSSATLAGVQIASLVNNPELCLFTLSKTPTEFTPVPDRGTAGSCGVRHGVEVSRIGVNVNRSFVATCKLTAAFAAFEEQVLQPAALRHFGKPVVDIEHWGTYACRNRNSRQAGSLSEHGRSNAIDVAAFRLADGRRITVLDGWRGQRAERAFLRDVHAGACGIFHGVIGPDGDRHHLDHLHFDMGAWRFCR